MNIKKYMEYDMDFVKTDDWRLTDPNNPQKYIGRNKRGKLGYIREFYNRLAKWEATEERERRFRSL